MPLIALILVFFAQDPASGPGLDALIQQARSLPPSEVLLLADEVETPQGQEWEAAARDRLAQAGGAEALFLARYLANGDSPAGAPALVRLLDAGGDLGQAAAASLGHPAFDLDPDALGRIGSWLAAHDIESDPRLFAEVAVSLHAIGDGTRRSAAIRTLRTALSSPSEAAYSAAALALARLDQLAQPAVRREVERLAQTVGEDAVLARTLLEYNRRLDRERRKLEAYERLLREQMGTPSDYQRDLKLLEEVLETVEKRHMEGQRFTRQQLVEAAAQGILHRLDAHSSFFPGGEFKRFIFDLNPEYGGIGAYVNTVNDVFTVIRPIYSGPAYEAGLLSDDKILEVDGWPTAGEPNDEIIKRLKGQPGTKVVVKVFRRGWTEPKEVDIVRRKIEIPTLQTESFPGGVLYVELVNFADDCAKELYDAIREAADAGQLKGVVLDLRNNPGGYLNQAVDICDVFLPAKKVVVTAKYRDLPDEVLKTRRPALVPEDIPLVVLVNRFSASASEIVAGVLSEHGRAITVGQRTFGKGSIQHLIPLRTSPDDGFKDLNGNRRHDDWEEVTRDLNQNGEFDFGSRMRMTVGYYYLPDGSSIHTQRDADGRVLEKGGFEPSVAVEFPSLELWKIRELERLLEEEAVQNYAKKVHEEQRELAVALAVHDGGSVASYPGWDEFYESLGTSLDPDDLRRYVRLYLRRIVSDDRGRVFAGNGFYGDYVEDPQLQEAIRRILSARGTELGLVREYAETFPPPAPQEGAAPVVAEEGDPN